MKKYRLAALAVLAVLLGLLVAPLAAHATTNIRSGTTASIAKGETMDATAYLAGSTVTVAGTVRGDLYCAGQNIDITGTIEGDVICAGQSVNISGTVLGDVRVAGQAVTLTGPIARSVTAFGQTVTVTGSAVVNVDATLYATSLQLGGRIGRDVNVGGQNVTVEGTIGRNAVVNDQQLSLGGSAKIGGALDYTSNAEVKRADGSQVTGKVTRHTPPTHERQQQNAFATRFWMVAYWFGAFIILGLFVLALAPRSYAAAGHLMIKQGGWALLAGLVALIVTPIVAVILMATIIGLPAGIVLMLLWAVAMMTSFVYSAYTTGGWVAEQFSWNLKWQRLSALLVGLLLLSLLMLIPVVGGLFGFLALVWGLGGIVLAIGRYLKTPGTEAQTPKKAKA